MARGRFLSKSLSTSEKFATLITRAGPLAEFCQTLYALLVLHTDDFGRQQGDPFTIKHVVHPSSSRTQQEFSAALAWLHSVKLIKWYVVRHKRYVQVEHFDDHQQGLHKRTRSQYPPPTSGKFRELPGNSGLREEKKNSLVSKDVRTSTTVSRSFVKRPKGRTEGPKGRTCPHTPRCATYKACLERILRKNVVAS